MDNDDKIVGEILTRRDALRAAGLGGLTLALGGVSKAEAKEWDQNAVHLVATPEVEEGPFFVDEGLNRKNLLEGTERESVVKGRPLSLKLTVFGIKKGVGAPFRGAVIDIWHADAKGVYSDEPKDGGQTEDTTGQKWLRGHQITNREGKVEFETIVPGWYEGRTIHIHAKVRAFDRNKGKTLDFSTQFYFDDSHNEKVLQSTPYNSKPKRDFVNKDDGLYSVKQADGSMVGSHLHLKTTESQTGVIGHFSIALKLD